MRTIRKISQGVFGAAVLGALVVGTAQAVAQPTTTAGAENTCEFWECMNQCVAMGYDGGRCTDPRYTLPWCECYVW